MVQTISELDTTKLLDQVVSAYHYFKNNHNAIAAEKAKQLGKKLSDGEFAIAFCGHFSAGKSSMINKIVGENLLPSSPIPTSANLVKIKIGDEYAKVFFKEGNPRLYPAPYDFEKVKSFCKDGDQIQSIEISHNTNILPKEAVILDTPGIDSTDDAHRIATESALHLADLVFYVMDYNHVQSELNFLFTKELTKAGKEVYLIINQIDKHREEELGFEEFQNSVSESFASWGVKPAYIFYTSLKEESHPYNQFSELTTFIHNAISNRKEILPISVFHSLKKLTQEHADFVSEGDVHELERIDQLLSTAEMEPEAIRKFFKENNEKLETLQNEIMEKEKFIEMEIDKILKNAYLMPFQTRELAESYLQAVQSDFKVGLLFSKQKTEMERQARLQKFYADFQDKVKTQIEWHLKELFNQVLKNNHIHHPTLLTEVQGFMVDFSEDLLVENVKSGAKISGEYVLNYTNDVSEAIKKVARNRIRRIKEQYIDILFNNNKEEKQTIEVENNHLRKFIKALDQKDSIIGAQTAIRIKLEQLLSGHYEEVVSNEEKNEMLAETAEVEVVYLTEEMETDFQESKQSSWNKREEDANLQLRNQAPESERLVERLQLTANELSDLPGFRKMCSVLTQKAESLEHKQFTVALFGAFSAGKSSFANALIGEKLLPVSPNPTTAAINKILPVDELHPHGSVLVKIKDEAALFEDVNRSLSVFQMEATNFEESMILIDSIMRNSQDFDANEKTHYAFLTAFSKGFDAYHLKLGEWLETDLTEFKDYVAKEEKSCLVEEIKVFFDCELTKKGITLVDTPGADSINARHTGVAFDYIKNSDAILFVTYYNHAFSKADREFLIQLGRVKDSFELDKMFFIVNAIDLANDEEEMCSVMNYVEDQLIQYGIRKPHLYPVSSLLAIQEKLEKLQTRSSGINDFENQFYSFINQELMLVTIKAAESEWQRSVHQLKSFIASSQEDQEVKRRKFEELTNEQNIIRDLVENQSFDLLQNRLSQEISELVYYIKQRVFFRFNDFFRESFNPSVLKDDGRNLKKALNNALEDFLTSFGFDFAQELRATSIRIEVFMNVLIREVHESTSRDALKVNKELFFRAFEPYKMESIPFESAFLDLDRGLFKKALSYFKNPKAFFEKNEKKYCSDELERTLSLPTDQYLQKGTNRLNEYYSQQLEEVFNDWKYDLQEQCNEFYQGMLAAINDEISIEQLEEILKRINNF
ncbi:dynamin family protein [Bacillus massilinigeriensis]|uniref:dynamin family protein n=1 Tax=Bacillus massilionigeriensis TaxID=1805475 RepID=UPI00096B384F|nr:dynamin family protein [Bacillus massilionigeriensis]